MDRSARCASCGHLVSSRLALVYDGVCPWCLAQATFGPEAPEPQAATGAKSSDRLGRYVRTEKLGSGGMGEVWKALDTELNRWVALKFLKEEEPAIVARFMREARTSAGLSHPGIAAIYEVGESEGRRFIAMQYVPGRTMDSIPWKDRRLLVGLFRDVARALDHAHRSGVIHRDLKPANLIVQEKADGWSVAILDFGLARPIEGGERLSRSGEVFGTVPYMSPEQSRGEALDVRTDVYSLGATMYELLTGRPPFVGANLVELIRKIGSEEPSPVRKANPAIDRDLETIVMACLQKDRGRRYPSARALASDLERWLRREPIRARPPSAFYRLRMGVARRKAATAAVAAGLALASVVGWWAMVGSPGAEQARLTAEAMKVWAEARGLAMAGVDPEGIRGRASAAREAFDRAIAVKEDAPSLVMKSRCLQLEARDDDALKTARRAHELDPAHAEARLELAKLLLLKYRDSRSTPGYSSSESVSGKEIDVTLSRLGPESSEERHLRQEAERLLAPGGASPALASLLNGLLAMGREEFSNAADALAAYTKLENWDARGFQLEGMSRFFSLKFQPAISAFDQSLLRVPRGAVYRWRGMARHFLGFHEQAVVDLTKAIELDRTDSKAYDNRGVVLSRLGRYDDAISDYTKALELEPRGGRIYVGRGTARKKAGHFDEAMGDFSKAIEIDPADSRAYSSRGTAKCAKGDLDGAIADYTRAIEIEPTYVPAYSNRGRAKSLKRLSDEAIADFSRAIELAPGLGPLYTNRGAEKFSKGHLDEALADHNRAIELDPGCATAYTNRGAVKHAKGLLDEAIVDHNKSIELDPGIAGSYANRGAAKHEKGLLDEALADLNKAAELDPGLAVTYTSRGNVKRAQGHLDEAIADHSKSIDLDPSLPEAHANRGFARREKGLLRPALEDFETALKVASPHWPRRPATEKILEALAPHVLCLEGEALLEGDKYREAICKFAEVVKRWPKSEFAVPAAYNCACGHTLLGEKEIALDWLEKTVELGLARTEIGRFEDNPTFDPLRDDERYKKLIAKLKGK